MLRLKELLKEKDGASTKWLAERTKLSYTYMAEVVRGDKFPRPDKLRDIAIALDVDIRELFVHTKEPNYEAIYKKNMHGDFEEIGKLRKEK